MSDVYIDDIGLGVSQDIVDQAVRDYVAVGSGLSGERVLHGNSDGPAPVDAYATVLLTTSRREGRAQVRYAEVGNTIHATTIASFALMYQIQWYRDGAHEMAVRFRQWTESPGGVMCASQHGLYYSSCSEVVQIDSIISAEWEERAAVDLTMGHYRSLTQDAGIIESVLFSVNGGAQEVVR